jgi:AbrB family looped-hinge helix DNA binding protein
MTKPDPEAGVLSSDEHGASITYQSNTAETPMRITTKGQVTIPLVVREHLGLLPHTEVEFEIRGDTAVLTKATGRRRGRKLVDHMRGRGNGRMSTDEILALTRPAEARKGR